MDNTITCAKDVEKCLKRTLQTRGLAFDPFRDDVAAVTVLDAQISTDICVVVVVIDKGMIDVRSKMWSETMFKFNLTMKDNGIMLSEAIYDEPDKAYLIYSTSSPTFN